MPPIPISQIPSTQLISALSELQHFCRQILAATAEPSDKDALQKVTEIARILKEIEAWLRNLKENSGCKLYKEPPFKL